MNPSPQLTPKRSKAFTLIEVLVSMVILAMIMLIITQVIGQAQRSWKAASSRVSQFREARIAFDTVTRNLRQATIGSYRSFVYANGSIFPTNVKEAPTGWKRYAELGFRTDDASTMVSGGGAEAMLPGHAVIFQAPLGKSITAGPQPGISLYDQLKSLLCVRGYFVQFGSDSKYVPIGLKGRLEEKNRYRLWEYRPPSEVNTAYDEAARRESNGDWTNINAVSSANYLAPVAENILLMVLAPTFLNTTGTPTDVKLSNTTPAGVYQYNSYVGNGNAPGGAIDRHRLPRSVQVFMVAMDEESAKRLEQQYGGSPPDLLGRAGVSFSDPGTLDSDMKKLRTALTEMRINYRMFNTTVFIPGADV